MSPRPNIITSYQGLCLDWRITPAGDGFVEAELLTPAKLSDAEYEDAQQEAIEAFGE